MKSFFDDENFEKGKKAGLPVIGFLNKKNSTARGMGFFGVVLYLLSELPNMEYELAVKLGAISLIVGGVFAKINEVFKKRKNNKQLPEPFGPLYRESEESSIVKKR